MSRGDTTAVLSACCQTQSASAGRAMSHSLPWWLVVMLEALWVCVLLPPDLVAAAEHILQGCVLED